MGIVGWGLLLICELLPLNYAAFHVNGVDAVQFHKVGGFQASFSTATVDQVGVIFAEGVKMSRNLIEGDVLRVGDAGEVPFGCCAYVYDLEVCVGCVFGYEFECLLGRKAHSYNEFI